MKRRDFLERWGLARLRINIGFLQGEFAPGDPDRAAAWELYVELLTRVATQHLSPEEGTEVAALDSVHELFGITREILRRHGPGCGEFAKLAIPVLNQLIRPFTARWHRVVLAEGLSYPTRWAEFRGELMELQTSLRGFTQALAAMAGVEDLTELETNGE